MIRDKVFEKVFKAINLASEKGLLGDFKEVTPENIAIEKPRNPEFGDFAVNVSFLARYAKKSPAQIAQEIADLVEAEGFELTVVNGFINFKTDMTNLSATLEYILRTGLDFGRNELGKGQKVLLEYVSANPTGPLHIGHGRWAAVGSALANIMKFSGYKVDQEFYINDAGNQINNLGKSLWVRVLNELGNDVKFPDKEEDGSKNYYPGEYLIDAAKEYVKENKSTAEEFFAKNPEPLNPSDEVVKIMSDFVKAMMLEQQKELLKTFKTEFDCWYSETALHQSGKVEEAIEKLKANDEIYEKDGADWFKSTKYGDDQDRVIVKSDGSYTYLTADVAYHYDKLQRGYDKLINIWGADHHGYVARIRASIQALGYNPNSLEVLLGQLVNLIVGGEQTRMGKRKKMYTLEDLIEEVGIDATRFWMIMRSIDTTLDFDIDLAKSCSDENPVYYVQYAHARASSIIRNAVQPKVDTETGETIPESIKLEDLVLLLNKATPDTFSPLWNVENEREREAAKQLTLKLDAFEDFVKLSAKTKAPYHIVRYLQELAADFHHFYTVSRVLNVESDLMKSRLLVVMSVKNILATALNLLGVNAPASM
ncbi:MAG: arginine--tRNA ligase [bacterium]